MTVQADLLPVAPAWSFACPDWIARLESGRSLIPDLPLDGELAQKALGIFNELRLPDVPGQPQLGTAAGSWFRDIVAAVFGSLERQTWHDAAGLEQTGWVRRVPEILVLAAKKQSKTTYTAALLLTLMLMNERPRAEMMFVGPVQEVADLAFQQATGMILADPEGYLQKRFHVQEHRSTITDRLNGAKLKIKTFDLRVMVGAKPTVVMLDELHVIALNSHAGKVLEQIRGGLMPNPESLLIITTTQSADIPAGVFKSELNYARGVRDGRITSNVRLLPILYEFPESMQTDPAKPWADPARWPMVLPNLGRSITIQRLIDGAAAAREKGEEEYRSWASQHLNVQIGLALHDGRWRAADYWPGACDPDLITLDGLLDRCEVVTIGIDGGGLDDLLALAVLGRDRETGDRLLWVHAWCRDDVLELRKSIAARLRDFEAAGELTIYDQADQDAIELADIVDRIATRGLLPEQYGIGFDSVGIKAIFNELKRRGYKTSEENGPLCSVFQGYRLNGAIAGMARALRDGTFRHGGQLIMDWCVGNAKPEQRGNAVHITKQVAGIAKIDPLLAAFNANQLMDLGPSAGADRFNEFLASPVMVI